MTPRGLRLAAAVSGAVATASAARFGITALGLYGDTQHYFYWAERFASGVSPYAAYVDPKNALSMMIEGAGIAIGRLAGVDDVVAARVVSVAVYAVTAALLWRLVHALLDDPIAAGAAVLALVGHWAIARDAAMSSQPKVFLLLFIVGALHAAARGRPVACAAWSCLAFLCWQPALLMAGALPLLPEVRRGGPRRLLHVGAAFLAPLLLYEAYFALTGTLAAQLQAAFVLPGRFMTGKFSGLRPSAHWLASMLAHGFSGGWVVLGIAAYGALRHLGRAAAGGEWRRLPDRLGGGWLYFCVTAAGATAFTLYDHQGLPDTYFVVPFVAVLVGAAATTWISDAARLGRRASRVAAAVALGTLAVIVVSGPPAQAQGPGLAEQRRLGSRVEEWRSSGTTVDAIGCTHLLAFCHAPNWSPYGFFYRGLDDYIAWRSGGTPFSPEIAGEWPSVILLSRRPPRGSDTWLGARYREVTTPPFAQEGIHVYRLREASSGPP